MKPILLRIAPSFDYFNEPWQLEPELQRGQKPRRMKAKWIPLLANSFLTFAISLPLLVFFFVAIKIAYAAKSVGSPLLYYTLIPMSPMVIIPTILLFRLPNRKKQRDIIANGDIVTGTILATIVERLRFHLVTKFDYQGRTYTGEPVHKAVRRGVANNYQNGRQITVIVDPKNPSLFVVYPAAEYRVTND